jgi:hypothetical protein
MFLIILGVVLMILSTVAEIKSPDEKLKAIFQKAKFTGIAIVIIGLLISIFPVFSVGTP